MAKRLTLCLVLVWSQRASPPVDKSTQSRRNAGGRVDTNVPKKTGKNAPIVVQNAWAALQEDTTSEEEEEETEDEDEQQAMQVQPEPEPDRASEQEQVAASIVHLGRSGDPKVQQLMDLGANGQEARAALEQANGDVEAAAEIFFGSWENRLASLGTWEATSD